MLPTGMEEKDKGCFTAHDVNNSNALIEGRVVREKCKSRHIDLKIPPFYPEYRYEATMLTHSQRAVFLFLWALVCSTASAEGIKPDPGLTRVLEAKANQILERYLSTRDFQISIEAYSNGKSLPKATRAPYEPRSAAPKFSSLSIDELNTYVRQVKMDVTLTSRVKGATGKLEELLVRGLRLDKARGDKIIFSSLNIEIESEAWMKEKAELKQELATLRAEKGITTTVAPQPPTRWQQPLVIGVSILFFLSMALVGRSVSSGGFNVGRGLAAIARGMSDLGGMLGRGGDKEGFGTLQANIQAGAGGGGGTSGGEFTLESKSKYLSGAKEELLSAINQDNSFVVARYLMQLTANSESVGKAVACLELFGQEIAEQLYSMLGTQAQDAISQFLRTGSFLIPKMDLMIDVAEDVKTKLLIHSVTALGSTHKVSSLALQVTDDDLLFLVEDLDERMLPRLLLALEPTRVASLMPHAKRSKAGVYSRLVPALSNMPEAQKDSQYDAAISRAFSAIINQTKLDPYRPFMKTFQEIIDITGDEVGEEIVRELSAKPSIGSYFRQNMVTVDTFFSLPSELQNEILSALSNREIGGFAMGLEEEMRGQIFGMVAARRKGLVQEEFESLTSRGGNQALAVARKAKEVVIKMIRGMKAEGVLTPEMLAGNPEKSGTRRRKKAA